MDDRADSGSPWHAGERAIQRSIGAAERMDEVGRKVIRRFMPEQHRQFFPQLPFVVIGAVDGAGDAWATLRAGEPGFLQSPDPGRLALRLERAPDDPADAGMEEGAAIGLLGIELHTRRRNRLNGRLRRQPGDGFVLEVEESFGNCPQYIHLRDFSFTRAAGTPSPQAPCVLPSLRLPAGVRGVDESGVAATGLTAGAAARHSGHAGNAPNGAQGGTQDEAQGGMHGGAQDRTPDRAQDVTPDGPPDTACAPQAVAVLAARRLIEGAATFFVASYADEGGRRVDVSHRGGPPGFVHLAADGTLTVPDYAGNRFFSTLGNLLLNGRAGLVFPDFASGGLLQLSGDAELELDPQLAAAGGAGAERLWRFRPRHIVWRAQALPLCWEARGPA